MFRILTITFALAVAIMAATIITRAAQSASESFRANFHHVSVIKR